MAGQKAGEHVSGRPVNSQAAPALMKAALELVAEYGYEKVTMQMIADRAGVGRQTAYRRWPTKADLVLDAMLDATELHRVASDGPVTEMLERFLQQTFMGLEIDGPAFRSLIASAQIDSQFRENFYARFAVPRDAVIAQIIQQGIDRGELVCDTNLAQVVEMVHGAFWYRLLLGRELDEGYARTLAQAALGPLRTA